MSIQETLEIMIVDGINIYMREVLREQGLLDKAALSRVSDEDLLQRKYQVARNIAAKWRNVLQERVEPVSQPPGTEIPRPAIPLGSGGARVEPVSQPGAGTAAATVMGDVELREDEVQMAQEILRHAIVSAINTYVRETLIPRCPPLKAVWDRPDDTELDRLKFKLAEQFAAKWAL